MVSESLEILPSKRQIGFSQLKKTVIFVSPQERDARQLIANGKINEQIKNRTFQEIEIDKIKETHIQTQITKI